jgi:two-component system, cell cycle sensor histidine kinase and response regulator CckA
MLNDLSSDFLKRLEEISSITNIPQEKLLEQALEKYYIDVLSTSPQNKPDTEQPPNSFVKQDNKMLSSDIEIQLDLEKSFRSLVESMPGIFYRCESVEPWKYVFISPNIKSFCGFPAEYFLNNPNFIWNDFLFPEDRDDRIRILESCIAEKKYFIFQYRIKHADGSIHWIFEKGCAISSKNGDMIWIEGFFIDITEQRDSEIILIEREEKFRQLAESIHEVFLLGSSQWETLYYVSPAYEDVWGRPSSELYLKPLAWVDSVLEEDRLSILPLISVGDLKPGDEIRSPDFRIKRPDNSFRWISARVFPVCNTDGVVFRIAGIAEDITERKMVEEWYKEEHNKYESTIKAIPDLLFEVDQYGHIFDYSAPRRELLYTSPQNFLGKTVSEILPKQASDIILHAISKASYHGWHRGATYSLDLPNGRHWFELSISLKGENLFGKDRFITLVRDITERKQTEEKLIKSELQFRLVWEKSFDAMRITDQDGNIILVNDSFCAMVQKTKEELEGKPLTVTYSPEHQFDVLKRNIERFSSRTVQPHFERKLKLWNGVEKWFELSNSFLEQEEDEPLLLSIFRDITERKKAESETLRLQNLESLGILAGGIAHDFNNILATILGRVSIVLDEIKDETLKPDLVAIEKASRRAESLTRRLLTFAKGGRPEKTTINLKKIIDDITKFSLSGSNVSPVFDFKSTLLLEADSNQIAQVIQNIVINAQQAMPDGGTIKILTSDFIDDNKKQFIKISIIDEGAGIPKEHIDKIFNPYFTTKKTGSGLGLSVCYSIIKRHEGKIYVNSDLGAGTTFTILLPSVPKEVIAGSDKKNIIQEKLNILIMDDEIEIRELLERLLKNLNHNVTSSKEGRETIGLYKKAKESGYPYDLVFMDLTVKGGLGGKETVKILKEYDPTAITIVSSGYSDDSLLTYKEDGFDGMLKKPYTKNELSDLIYYVFSNR